jgi:chromosome segregation ATPase
MMSALIPPAAATEALALLAIIADPAAAKTKLDELVAESQAAKGRIDEANLLTRQLAGARASWAKEREQALAEVDTKMAEADRRLAAVEARETAFRAKEQALTASATRLAQLDLEIAEKQRTRDGITAQLDALKARL